MGKRSKIIGTRYVLAVKDLAKSVRYYEKELGFSSWSGNGWHFLRREKFMVMLGECATGQPAFETGDHSYFAYIDVENIDALYNEYRSRSIEVINAIEDKPGGQREFAVRTIDGHRIMFGEATKSN
jgi:catechol 2,3-dioxygenase-like lactoylglutathione lyase family enzyme